VICREVHLKTRGVTFHRVLRINFPRSLKRLIFAWQVQRVLDRLKPDLVHTHERIFNADIYSMHGTPPKHWANEVLKRPMNLFDRSCAYLDRRLLESQRCKHLIPVSRLVEDAYLQHYGPQKDKVISTSPPGVDDRFHPNPAKGERASWRKSLDTPTDACAIIFVSQNWEHKGLDTILRSIAIFPKENRPHLWVVGRGHEKRYLNRAKEMGIETFIHFTGVIGQELPELYRSADIFVLPSKFDTFALVALEAMACGLPAVLSSTVGATQLIEEGVNGQILKNWQDHQALASLIRVLLDRGTREKMGKQAAIDADSLRWDKIIMSLQEKYSTFSSYHP